jgi:hypothetical protein
VRQAQERLERPAKAPVAAPVKSTRLPMISSVLAAADHFDKSWRLLRTVSHVLGSGSIV